MRSRILSTTLTLAVAAALGAAAPVSARQEPTPSHVNDCWSSDNGPVVLDSIEFSPTTVDVTDGPARVRVTARAHDTGGPGAATGIARIRLTAFPLASTVLHRSAGAWVGTLTVPQGWPDGSNAGDIRADLLATDKGGRSTDLDVNGLDGYAVTVTDSSPDQAPPVLEGLRVSAHHVDTTQRARRVGLVARVVDDSSGVASVLVGHGRSVARLTRVSDTDRYRGSFAVRRWQRDGTQRLTATVADRVGNSFTWSTQELQDAGFDSHVHVTSGPADRRPPRRIRVVHVDRHVDVRRHHGSVVVSVLLADNRGVTRARAFLSRFGSGWSSLHRVSGTARRGVWRTRMPVSPCGHDGSGTGRLHLDVQDGAGHSVEPGAGIVHVRARHREGFVIRSQHTTGDDLVFAFGEPVHGISTDGVVVASDAQGDRVAGSWTCTGGSGTEVSCLTGAVHEARFSPADPATFDPFSVDFEPPHHLDVLDRYGNLALDPMPDIDD